MDLDEKELIKIVKPYLEECRPGDWYHALNVVKWVKVLGKGRTDLKLLIPAAYIHDIGWFKLTSDKLLSFDEGVLKLESKANENTEKNVKLVLRKLNFSGLDIENVIRLIKATEKYHAEREDEAILVDADSLSKLGPEHLTRKFQKAEIPKVLASLEKEMPGWISTKKAKELYPKMMERIKKQLLG